MSLCSHASVCDYRQYNIKLSVDKIIIIIVEIIITIIINKK